MQKILLYKNTILPKTQLFRFDQTHLSLSLYFIKSNVIFLGLLKQTEICLLYTSDAADE